jgi:hypothetical protein
VDIELASVHAAVLDRGRNLLTKLHDISGRLSVGGTVREWPRVNAIPDIENARHPDAAQDIRRCPMLRQCQENDRDGQ